MITRTAIKSQLKQISWIHKLIDTPFFLKLTNKQMLNERIRERAFYESVLGSKSKLIFDVGANVGNKAIIFLDVAEKIILFEPDYNNVRMLKSRLKNIQRVTILDYALSTSPGTATYYAISHDSAYNSLSIKHINTVAKKRNIINNKNTFTKYTVNTQTLDFFIETYGIPNYLKIDVEGYEKEVIYGLTRPIQHISFEANLPEFLEETQDTIEHLDKISNSAYVYNYSVDNKLELTKYISKYEFKNLLTEVTCKSLEVYCKLMNEKLITDVNI